ncbi:MAG: hypothetical protein WC783_04405 [Candidatus Paceibacterota bacterium]|jgi:hypothetical protein
MDKIILIKDNDDTAIIEEYDDYIAFKSLNSDRAVFTISKQAIPELIEVLSNIVECKEFTGLGK